MLIKRYDRVVSRLPLILEHTCQGTSEVQVKTRSKDIKDTSIKVMTQLIQILRQAYYTKNDNYALKKVLIE